MAPTHIEAVGDLTFGVRFVVTAAIYLGWRLLAAPRRVTA
jgi:hypothetical protein